MKAEFLEVAARTPATESTPYTEAEVQESPVAACGDRLGHAWGLALSGLRRGEIAGLRWQDVDLEAKTLLLGAAHQLHAAHTHCVTLMQPPLTVDSTLDERLALFAAMEEEFGAIFDTLAQSAPIAEGVTSTTVTITGGGGNDLTLYISRPADSDGRCRVWCTCTAAAWPS